MPFIELTTASCTSKKETAVKGAISETQRIYQDLLLSRDENELGNSPEQYRPPLFFRLFPLSRWRARQQHRQGNFERLQHLSHGFI